MDYVCVSNSCNLGCTGHQTSCPQHRLIQFACAVWCLHPIRRRPLCLLRIWGLLLLWTRAVAASGHPTHHLWKWDKGTDGASEPGCGDADAACELTISGYSQSPVVGFCAASSADLTMPQWS